MIQLKPKNSQIKAHEVVETMKCGKSKLHLVLKNGQLIKSLNSH